MTTSSNEMNTSDIQIIELDDDPKDVPFNSSLRNSINIDNQINKPTNKYIDCFQIDDDDDYDETQINLQPTDLNQPTLDGHPELLNNSCEFISDGQLTSKHNKLNQDVKETNHLNNQLNNNQTNNQFNSQSSKEATVNHLVNPVVNLVSNPIKNEQSDQKMLLQINQPIKPQINQELNQHQINQQINYQIQPQPNHQQNTIVINSVRDLLNQPIDQPLNRPRKKSIEQPLNQSQSLDSLSDQQSSAQSLISNPTNQQNDHVYEELKPTVFKIPDPNNPKIRTLTLKFLPPVNNHPKNSPNNQNSAKIEIREKKAAPTNTTTTNPTIQVINPVKASTNMNTVTSTPKLIIKSPTKVQQEDPPMRLKTIKLENIVPPIILTDNKPKPKDQAVKQAPFSKCITEGCKNRPVKNEEWDQEYCSSKCLIKNCRNIFERYIKEKQSKG